MAKEKNKSLVFAAIIFIAGIVLFLLSIYFNQFNYLEKKEFFAKLEIDSKPGIALEDNLSIINFGRITPLGSSVKDIIIENNYNFSVDCSFDFAGNISDFLIYDKKISLEAFEKRNVTISTIVISDEEFGEYSGVLKVVMKKG